MGGGKQHRAFLWRRSKAKGRIWHSKACTTNCWAIYKRSAPRICSFVPGKRLGKALC